MAALLRRVRSGSSLRPGMSMHSEEVVEVVGGSGGGGGGAMEDRESAPGNSTEQWAGSGSRGRGAMMGRFVRGLDSFVEGR